MAIDSSMLSECSELQKNCTAALTWLRIDKFQEILMVSKPDGEIIPRPVLYIDAVK